MALLKINMKRETPASSVNDGSLIFGAKDGQADTRPEPFTVATLWTFLFSKLTGLYDPAGAASSAAAGAVSTAGAYTDAQIDGEAAERAQGDADTLSAAQAYTDASPARLYVQQTRPTATGPWQWYQTDASGKIVDLTINDGGA